MITTINEFRKLNEDINFEQKWNNMSYNQKEEMFADEFDKFFDAQDNYLKNIADIMFNSKWNDLTTIEQDRIKSVYVKSKITEAFKSNDEDNKDEERSNLEDLLYVGNFEV